MRLREIPPSEWPEFCEAFTAQHGGREASLVRVDPWGHSEVLTQGRCLERLYPGAEHPDGEAEVVAVVLGPDAPGDEPLTHAVDAPERIWLADNDEEGHQAVRIDSADGGVTLVVFRGGSDSSPG